MAIRYSRRGRRTGLRRRKIYRSTRRKLATRALANKVRALSRRVRHNTAVQHLTERIQELQVVDAPYVFSNLTNWSLKGAIFGTDNTDWNQSNKIYHKKMTIDCRLTAGNEYDLIGYRVFLVSIRDGANVPARWNSGTGGLALTGNQDYASTSFGKAMLNPRVFKIHKMKSFFTTNYGANAATTGNAGNQLVKEWKWTIYPRHTVYNPTDNVSNMVTSYDPSKCYYLLIFNDNSSAELEAPVFSAQLYHTIVAAQ